MPQRQAIVVAKQAAALDVLSGGRFILGVGVGWLQEEFQFLNADFARRSAVTDEAITTMRVLWRDKRASFQGQYFSFSNAVFFPKPTSGGPPLWVGGNSPQAIRRAARFGGFDRLARALRPGCAGGRVHPDILDRGDHRHIGERLAAVGAARPVGVHALAPRLALLTLRAHKLAPQLICLAQRQWLALQQVDMTQ